MSIDIIDLTLEPSQTINLTLQSIAGISGPEGPRGPEGPEGPPGPPPLVIGRTEVNLVSYGADPTGMTMSDDAFDDAYEDSPGGAILTAPPGKYRFDTESAFEPNGDIGHDLQGCGSWITVFSLESIDARFRFSQGGGVEAGQRGSKTGNFSIDGNGIATNPFFFGLSDDRTLENIWVKNCTEDGVGVIIEQLNNAEINKLVIANCQTGLLLDRQANGNVFNGLEIFDCGIHFKTLSSGGSGIFYNKFVGGLLEHFNTPGAPAPVSFLDLFESDSCIFDGMQFSMISPPEEETPLVKIRSGVNNRFTQCLFQGAPDFGVGIDAISGGVTAAILDRCTFNNLDSAWKLGDTTFLEIQGSNPTINVTQRFRNQPDGENSEANLVGLPQTHPYFFKGASGSIIIRSNRDGDVGAPRLQIFEDGTIFWGNGVDNPDIAVYRIGPRRLHTDMQFEAETISPKTTSGPPTDASFGTPPRDGSLCLDVTNHRLYVRDGGVWKYAALT